MPRLKEIINVSKKPHTPSLTVYLKKERTLTLTLTLTLNLALTLTLTLTLP